MAYLGVSPSNGVRKVHTYTATSSQTTFSGAGAENISLSYRDSTYIDVYQNGVKLGDADYTATSGTSVVLGTGASASDLVVVVVYDVFSVADTVSKTDGGTFDNNINITGNLHITGTDTSDQIIIENTDAGTGTAPDVVLFRNSASPADNDAVGRIDFRGQDDGSNSKDYATIFSNITDATAATAAGSLSFQTRNGSNQAVRLFIGGDGSVSTPTLGTSNLALGVNAGNSIASGGNYNTVVGDEAGTAITTGDENVMIGYVAGDAINTSSQNVAVGAYALTADTKGSKSVAIGRGTLNAQNFTSATDSFNTAVGDKAGYAVTTGIKNTLIGAEAGDALTDADFNTALGYKALSADTKGSNNVAIGYQALMTQNFTSATDSVNTAVGHNCGTSITTSKGNALLGANAGDAITTGLYNTCIGTIAGSDITEGEANVMIGYSAGSYSNDFITGSQNNCIGAYTVAGGTSDVGANSLGYNLTAHGGYTTVGNASNDIRALHGSTTWSTVSDERYKKDIVDSTAGLSFINALKPRTFKYKTLGELPETFSAYKADSTEVFKNENTNHGFIAQEVKQAIDADSNLKDGFRLWDKRGDGSQEIAETALIPMLVKAIQELSAKVTSLEAEVKALKGE